MYKTIIIDGWQKIVYSKSVCMCVHKTSDKICLVGMSGMCNEKKFPDMRFAQRNTVQNNFINNSVKN